ncbi:aldose epimerase family protein [Shimia sp.]|uniref:aldose epimerase family protein n=1 Tax=Shimia sp. TaxID=1954381 RepID=UPI0032991EFF
MNDIFGTMPNGDPVERVKLTGGGLTAHVMTYGAVLQDLRLDGHDPSLVLGFSEFAPYLDQSPYFGAMAGRCANRIRDGHFEIDGETFQLDRNYLGKHSLHGGADGTGKKVWQIEAQTTNSVTLSIELKDGHMGFPGDLRASVIFSLLPDGVLDVVMQAVTSKPTLCNLAHHGYWALDGGASVEDHLMQISADGYLVVDDELIPTGEIAPTAGTRFDYRTPAPIRQGAPLDHNFCLSSAPEALRDVASVKSTVSGVRLDIRTTEPGLQIYDGARVNPTALGLDNQNMGAHAGIAIEPQRWPDANHHAGFPGAVLRPGETYRQHTQFKVSKDTK